MNNLIKVSAYFYVCEYSILSKFHVPWDLFNWMSEWQFCVKARRQTLSYHTTFCERLPTNFDRTLSVCIFKFQGRLLHKLSYFFLLRL